MWDVHASSHPEPLQRPLVQFQYLDRWIHETEDTLVVRRRARDPSGLQFERFNAPNGFPGPSLDELPPLAHATENGDVRSDIGGIGTRLGVFGYYGVERTVFGRLPGRE